MRKKSCWDDLMFGDLISTGGVKEGRREGLGGNNYSYQTRRKSFGRSCCPSGY